MNLSYNWLKTYIDPELTPTELCDLLTSIGLEVGGLEQMETIKGGMEGLMIGEVITCAPHPNSDHLSKTIVNIGNDEFLPIVCGAPNVAENQKVVVAKVGAVLFQGNESFTKSGVKSPKG
jgi:phenylalanyl-tRNA synthetase beta chain